MLHRALIATGALMISGAVAYAAKECPIEPFDLDKAQQAIEKAASCQAAYELMNACRTNAGGDVAMAQVVIAKCEKVFVTRGDNPTMRTYRQEREACVRKYAKSQGTMYASFQATCQARAAVRAAR